MGGGGLGLADELFEREFRLEAYGSVGNFGGDAASKGLKDWVQVEVKMTVLEQPVFAAVAAIERNPVHGAFRELEFPRGVAGEADSGDDGMLETRAHGRPCFVEVAARKILFERRDANADAIEFNSGAGRGAVALAFVGQDRRRAGEYKQ